MSYQIFQVITLKKYIMKTTLFLFLSLLLWCSFSSFKNDSTRPNGWYYMIDKDRQLISRTGCDSERLREVETRFNHGFHYQ